MSIVATVAHLSYCQALVLITANNDWNYNLTTDYNYTE